MRFGKRFTAKRDRGAVNFNRAANVDFAMLGQIREKIGKRHNPLLDRIGMTVGTSENDSKTSPLKFFALHTSSYLQLIQFVAKLDDDALPL